VPQEPNILLICTDQQRFDALGAYGNEEIQTPSLDRLAADGVLFENCYVQSPVCAPTRATMLTGKYPHAHGLWANGVALPPHERLFTKELADGGYDCGLVGKLHLAASFAGRTEARVDDGFRVFRWAHDPYQQSPDNAYHRWLKANHPRVYEAGMDRTSGFNLADAPTEAHYSRWVGNETIEFLQNGREADKPFCFIANFYDPHHAFGAPPEYLDRYEADALSRPRTRDGELADKPPIYTEASEHTYAGTLPGFVEYDRAQLQQVKAAYYAMVSLVDDEVGRILTALEESGLAENTLVVFTSDHGEMLGDHQLMLKGPMMYECAVRVPLILRWPGILPAGQRRSQLVQMVDLEPTILQATGRAPLAGSQGASLLDLAKDASAAWDRDWAYCEYRNSCIPYESPVFTTMLRSGTWKVVVHHGDPATERERTGELYDLSADPDELTNLWDDATQREQRLVLQEKLIDVMVATEDRSQPREANW